MAQLIQRHQPCPKCPSSDAMSIYEDNKGKQFWKCFSCGESAQLSEKVPSPITEDVDSEAPAQLTKQPGRIVAIPERDLSKETAQFFGVYTKADEWSFTYDGGFKVRKKELNAKGKKEMFSIGKIKGLFGQDKFPGGGRYVTITEGEFDACAAFQMTGSKYPTVSVRNGTEGAVKDCQDAYEWLNSFENIVVCFDADEPGQKAAKAVGELFGNKVKIVKLAKYKDANEYLSNRASAEFVKAWWSAEEFRPDGVVNGADLWEELNQPVQPAAVMYPYKGLNELTYGVRTGELVTVTGGTGLGKSQFLRELCWQILQKTDDKLGLLFMEENIQKTGKGLMSLAANKPLHLPTTVSTEEERREAFMKTMGGRRVELYKHFGSSAIDNLVNKIRYFAKGAGCKYIFFDHVSIAVSSQQNGDERKALDEIMTKLAMVVQECNIALFCVSHLKRSDGQPHEEGGRVTLGQLRGTGGIAQLSDITIALERDGQHDDPIIRNTTYMRVLKNRFSGDTGPAGAALYYKDTGRMLEYEPEQAAEAAL